MSPPAGVVDGLLAGRYRLGARIGAGANGEVWRARDERLERDVAVKVLRPELADDEDVRARFRAEARHAGRLRHPGIAAVFDFAEGDDGAWLVMELVEGCSLADVLRAEGRLPADRVLDVVAQTAAALQAAHDGGVVHRDVKPGNLLLRADGRLSVTDFGVASAAGAAPLTRTGQVVGTASYLSPEQASGQPVTGAADLYALGVVAHECLAGTRPFERDDSVAVLLAHLQAPPPALPRDVPQPVAELVQRLLAKDPAQRPASARQVQQEAAALRRAVRAPAPTAQLPTEGSRSVPLGLAARPGQRRAVRATAVALGLLALALGVRDARQDPTSTGEVPGRAPASTAPATGQTPRPQDEPEPAPVPVEGAVRQPVQAPVQAPAQAPGSAEVDAPEPQPVDDGAVPPGQQRDGARDQGRNQDREPGQDRGRGRRQEPPGQGRGQQRQQDAGRADRG